MIFLHKPITQKNLGLFYIVIQHFKKLEMTPK